MCIQRFGCTREVAKHEKSIRFDREVISVAKCNSSFLIEGLSSSEQLINIDKKVVESCQVVVLLLSPGLKLEDILVAGMQWLLPIHLHCFNCCKNVYKLVNTKQQNYRIHIMHTNLRVSIALLHILGASLPCHALLSHTCP